MCFPQEPAACSSAFITLLLARLTSPGVAPITRAAAAAYVASFLARAAYVPDELLVQSLQVCGWATAGMLRAAVTPDEHPAAASQDLCLHVRGHAQQFLLLGSLICSDTVHVYSCSTGGCNRDSTFVGHRQAGSMRDHPAPPLPSPQALSGWCLGFCRDADERERASQLPAAPPLSTRLDADAGPAKDQQHQVRGCLSCWGGPYSVDSLSPVLDMQRMERALRLQMAHVKAVIMHFEPACSCHPLEGWQT